MKNDTKRETTALILAGGASRRMGGQDKGLTVWRGKSLVLHTYQRVAEQASRVIISCNRNREQYAAIAPITRADRRENFQGPLAGLEAATPDIDSEFVLLTPCDMPLLPHNLASRLQERLEQSPHHQVCYATTGEDHHYLCALLRSCCLSSLPAFLDTGGRAVRRWYETIGAVSVPFDDLADCFLNLNKLD